MNFIETLQKKRSDYNYADQARTLAESLKQLSAGIYTEEERFVYELLQNAVDAFVETGEETLNIKIEIKNGVLCFMHNGEQFSERDIEGLCDVGRSNKSSDEKVSNKKKVGYKGIGFKSVFMQNVESVCVKTGNYCFKFDKNECARLMPDFKEGKLSPDETPWQIIPILCDAPKDFDTSNFNVATYIQIGNSDSLLSKINQLLSNPQFLLFLNASNINIELRNEGSLLAKAGRETIGEEVHLLRDGRIVSRWLVGTTEPIPVDERVREDLRYDFNTPQKLKEATDFQISFAINVDESGAFEKVNNSVVYTFLPTSYGNLGVPFLVNANFITDAGRQQLHQGAKWNRIIFEKIPEYFLKWIATISTHHEDYWKVLPKLISQRSDSLTEIFDRALRNALTKIAFIPRLKDKVVIKPADAVIDRVGISKSVKPSRLIGHINTAYDKNFSEENFVASQAISLFKEYGVFVFDKNCLPKLFEDANVFSKTVDQNVKLIEFLHSYDREHTDAQNEFRQMVKCSRCVLDENNDLSAPQDLFLSSGLKLPFRIKHINSEVYFSLNKDAQDWLRADIEIREFADVSFVKFLSANRNFITEENAIEVGRYLFKINSNVNILSFCSQYDLSVVKFSSRGGRLCTANELYLGDVFKPELSFEGVCNYDIFISSDYLPCDAQSKDIVEWKAFLLKFGVKEDISWEVQCVVKDAQNNESRIDKEWIEDVVDSSEKYYNHYQPVGLTLDSQDGYHFKASKICFNSYPFLHICKNIKFSKIILSRILCHNETETIETGTSVKVYGKCGYWDMQIEQNRLVAAGCKYTNHFLWLIENKEIIPTSQNKCELAKNVFINTIDKIKELAGSYLPVLDVDIPVSDSWQKLFNFKRNLTLEDYLNILSAVSNDAEVDNKGRISLIYEKLVESGYQNDVRISEWGRCNKLLSCDGDYVLAAELSYITIDGFKNANKVYVGRVADSLRDGILELLRQFGVRVITKDDVHCKLVNELRDNSLKSLLTKKLQYLAVLKGDFMDKCSFDTCCIELRSKIEEGEFFRCDAIKLTYGDEDDIVPRTTFSQGNRFYYVGELKPTRLEPLMQPLTKLFNLRHSEKELLVILITQDHDELVEFLREKGYETSFLFSPCCEKEPGKGLEVHVGTTNDPIDDKHKYAAQLEAQKFLMESRVDWTYPEGYGTSDASGKPRYYSTVDGIVDEDGKEFAIVLKSYKKSDEPFHINPEEWQWVVEKGALLVVYAFNHGVLDIWEVPPERLISGQSIKLSFSTKNLDPVKYADRISAFAETLHYFSKLTFDFDQLYIDPNSTRIRDIESQNRKEQVYVSDDEL